MSELLPIAEIDIVQRYRESHHRVAQMLAAGCEEQFIVRTTGRSGRSLAILKADPTFMELVAQYSRKVEAAWAQATDEFADLAIRNMLRSERMVADRLDQAEEEGEKIPLLTLDRIAQGRADRFGYGKHQTVKHEHDFAAMLDRAIDRSGARERMKTIDGRTEPAVIDAHAQPALPPSLAAPVHLEPPAKLASDPARLEAPPASRSFATVLGNGLRRRRVA